MKSKYYPINLLFKFLRFLSSVKLAVPLMLVIITVVGYGTIVESRYNAELAKIEVYQTWWFSLLMILLWINIFFAALSRWPWRWHHLGFLITHLGLLTVLAGGFITSNFGIDGSLRLLEGEVGDTVVMPEMELEVAGFNNFSKKSFPIPKKNQKKTALAFKEINAYPELPFLIEEYMPFVSIQKSFKEDNSNKEKSGPVAIEFNIKSPFFDVDEGLHSVNQKSLQMGPALFMLRDRNAVSEVKKSKVLAQHLSSKTQKSDSSENSELVVKDRASGKIIKKLKVNSSSIGQSIVVNDYSIKLIRSFQKARVGSGGISEGVDGDINPALELKIEKKGQSLRDVVFSKFSGFTLIQDKEFPLSFELHSEGSLAMSSQSDEGSPQTEDSSPMLMSNKNQVIFEFDSKKPESIKLLLFKEGKEIQSQLIRPSSTVTTPWMGIKLTLKAIHWNAQETTEVIATEPELKSNVLPPSALKLRTISSESTNNSNSNPFWVVDGEEKVFQTETNSFKVFYGNKNIHLPFKLKLEKFSKVDYPGTSMAKSYESLVEVAHTKRQATISMNEPLEEDGFLLYQSSYEELPNGKYASIFSVNKDPGRILKYWGSLILCLGIITFTLMRSRVYRLWKEKS